MLTQWCKMLWFLAFLVSLLSGCSGSDVPAPAAPQTERLLAEQPAVSSGDPAPPGFLGVHDARVAMQSNRLVIGGGAEKQFIHLVVHERGADQFRERVQCLKE